MSTKEYSIYIQHDPSPLKSWIRSSANFCLCILMIGVGVVVESDAMQWFAAIVTFLHFFALSSGYRKRNTFSLEGARKRLDEIEAAE